LKTGLTIIGDPVFPTRFFRFVFASLLTGFFGFSDSGCTIRIGVLFSFPAD
jgi:hypothetical protein